jgi:ADP-ribose pyrophosphatase YjhB (NUDIX family)
VTWTTFVGSGAIVEHDGRFLMVRQRRAYGIHWEMPGGYYDPGESLEATAAREVLEEANVAVEIGPLVCTLVWEREADERRNVLTWFAATVAGGPPEPRPQLEEDIEAAAFLDPADVAGEIHPMEIAVLDRWLPERVPGFHIHADVLVREDGTQDYVFRS